MTINPANWLRFVIQMSCGPIGLIGRKTGQMSAALLPAPSSIDRPIWVGLDPKGTRGGPGIDRGLAPPRRLVAMAMNLAMMPTA